MGRKVEVPKGTSATRVDAVLARLLPEYSRANLQRWSTEGRVVVNGKQVLPKHKVREGDIIDVEPGPPPPTDAKPDASVEFEVVHEDEALIVIDKPAGLVVHPGKGNYTGTLVNGLLARQGFERPPSDQQDPQGHLRPGVVHRIDKDTSGLLVVAKTEQSREHLKLQFSQRSVRRHYRAIVVGEIADATISTLYGRHPKQRLKFSSKVREGKLATTRVRVVERLLGATVVECKLETGRTHQIRVHLLEQMNAPLLGDTLYGRTCPDAGVQQVQQILGRQALHAAELGFIHPESGAELTFGSALPPDMTQSLEALRAPAGTV